MLQDNPYWLSLPLISHLQKRMIFILQCTCMKKQCNMHLLCCWPLCYLNVDFYLQNQTDPFMDFDRAPPGLLALDNMIYFAQSHKETYIKVRTSDTCICFLSLCIGYLYLFSIPVYRLFVSVFYPCVWVICICFLSLCMGYLHNYVKRM